MTTDLLPRSFGFYVTLSLLSVVEISSGFSISDYHFTKNLTRYPRQAKKCDGFKCVSSADCILDEQQCDGKVDCPDGSDEFNRCTDIQCPGYLFTCDYGACIDMDKKCNGKKDCRDNSDEANCVLTGLADKISSNCKSDQFECKSGQCISLDDKCSGTAECDDKSDETKETCLNMFCPGFTFKCDYGACVNGDAKCNGIKECIDNSDEEDCGSPTPGPVQPPTPPPPVPVPSGTTCELPELTQNGHWSLIGGVHGTPKQRVSQNTVLEFSCNTGYKLGTENRYVVCSSNGWSVPEMPTCLKMCPPLYSTQVLNLKCVNDKNIEIKCNEATHGASATFTCEPYYESTDTIKSRRHCINGSWNFPPPVCQPVCGEKKVSAVPLIVNGQKVEKGNYPWSTAIYQKIGSQFINVCGASMLTQKAILTAAHCVTDDRGTALPKENFMIAVGKYYNKYNDPRDTQAQYSQIETIYVHEKYKGDSQRFASDIALIITKDVLLLSKVVQPVCFQDLQSFNLWEGLVGVVTGWGYTTTSDSPSDELLEIPVPYKPDSVCQRELPSEWADKYFTYDKMCAGHYNRSVAVCKGDSGGGLVFQNNKNNRFYVHGIVSIGHGTQNGCNIQLSSLYTKVEKHYDWLERKVSQYFSAK